MSQIHQGVVADVHALMQNAMHRNSGAVEGVKHAVVAGERAAIIVALSRLVDGVLFIICCDYATQQAIANNFDLLEQSGAKVLGVIMNKLNLRYFGERMRYPGYSAARSGSASASGQRKYRK